MKRKCYDSYDYIDPDNLYTFPDSSVLRNKHEERDEQKARELEYRMVASKSLKLFINPIPVYSVEDILKIHQFLFEDIGTSKNTSRASRASNLSLIYSLFLVNFCL